MNTFAKYGIGLCVDETSPYFQNLMANYGNNGKTDNVRVIAPRPAQPVQQQPQVFNQPMYVQPQQAPQQPIMQPQAFQPPPIRREVPGAVISGNHCPTCFHRHTCEDKCQAQGSHSCPPDKCKCQRG